MITTTTTTTTTTINVNKRTAEPRLAGAIKELVVMGGAVLTQGNITSVATANFFNDAGEWWSLRLVY